MSVRSYPLTPMQRTMLVQSIVGAEAGHYILQMLGELEEELDEGAFEQAWRDLVARHDVLRTSFALEHSAESTQTVHEKVELPFERIDLRGLGRAERSGRIEALLAADRARGFDVARAPLLRVTLVRAGERDYRLLWTIHHALVDGRSLALLLEDLFVLYEARRDRRPVELAPPAPFESYVEWLLAQDPSEHAEFFRTALAGVEPQGRLAFGGGRGGPRESGEVHAVLSVERTAALQAFAREQDCTVHTLVQAAWSTVLRRLQGSDIVVFGATRACRYVPVPGIASMVGLLINTLPARADVGNDTPVPDLLRALRGQSIALRRHEHVPLTSILGWLGFEQGIDLFRTISVAESFVFDSLLRTRGPAWQKRSFELLERSEYPCLGTRLDDRLHIGLLYERPEIDARAAEWMVEHLESVLGAMPGHRGRPILAVADPGPRFDAIAPGNAVESRASVLPALDDAERRRVVVEWNRTDAPFPEDRLVHDLVAEQASQTPEALAVASSEGTLVYGELDRRASQIAHRLRREGVGPDLRVAVCMERSRMLPVALLAVLRAGGAYVPIDPANPPERIRFLVEDSSARVLLTHPDRAGTFAGLSIPVLAVDEDGTLAAEEPVEAPVVDALGPRNLAYVIYTSGSTGLPKGVLVEHRSLVNLIAFYGRRLGLGSAVRTTMIAGVGFDAAVVDLWPYLAAGASIHVPPAAVRADPRVLRRWLVEQKIEITSLPTVLGEALLREDWSDSRDLRVMLVGGDKLRAHPQAKLPFELLNTYGPTECTVDSTWYTVPCGTGASGAPPIGRPIANCRAYVVDERLEPVPAGVTGELLIGGVGVARGYLNRPELDRQKFVPDVFGPDPGAKLYRTGDQTRLRPDGEIEYVGRIDDQVQIRGHRVEPGEVEAVLTSHPGVASVAVLAREDKPSRVRLVAYVTSSGPPADELAPALRDHAASRLPDYMVPAVVVLDSLPVNLNGKIDRKALKPPEEYASWTAEVSVPPRDAIEARLVAIWEEVLEIRGIGVRDGFFDLGGDSLSVVTMLAAAEKAFEARISLPAVLREPTVEGLARIVRGEAPEARPFVVPLREGGARTPFFCVAGAGGGCHWFGDLALALRPDRPFLGLEPIGPAAGSGSEPEEITVESIASALLEEMRRVQPAGPYLLGGYSFGGLVAFEIAQQLHRAGETVGLLALIECDGRSDFQTRAGQIGVFVRNLLALDASRAARVLLDRATYALSLARQRLRQSSDERDVVKEIDLRKEADVAAALSYRPAPYPGDVTLFQCSDRPMTAVVDEHGGWGGVVRGSLRVRRVPGDHYTMLAPPNVAVLADALQRAIDGCRADDASLDRRA